LSYGAARNFANRKHRIDTTTGVHSYGHTMGTVLVMAKEPRPGEVKTRLCPPCRPEDAADIAAAALADTLDAVRASPADRCVLALDGRPGWWLPSGFDVIAQAPGSLDVRLAAAWSAVVGPCVQIGMDTPQLDPRLLDDALALLNDWDAVLGLAADGGWWAIGFRQPCPAAFPGVPMSTPATGPHQGRRLSDLDLNVAALPVLRDIDTFADAVDVARQVPGSRTHAAVERIALALT
jgi:glycosyltransferase A (GT-A) superfamily protein (DUF2064 family)